METAKKKPIIIVFATLKGGTGKTSTAFNIAGEIAATGKKVLLADFDAQANLTTNVGIDITEANYYSISNIFEDRTITPEKVITKHPIPELPTIDIIPSMIRLIQTEATILMNAASRERLFYNWIKRNEEALSEYDYMILDTNPSMSVLNKNAFYAADHIVLVSDVDKNSIQGCEVFCALWEADRADLDKEDNVSAILVNNCDIHTNVAQGVIEYYQEDEYFSLRLIKQYIPSTVKFKDTNAMHKPLNVLYPKPSYKPDGSPDALEKAKLALKAVVNELTERGIL